MSTYLSSPQAPCGGGGRGSRFRLPCVQVSPSPPARTQEPRYCCPALTSICRANPYSGERPSWLWSRPKRLPLRRLSVLFPHDPNVTQGHLARCGACIPKGMVFTMAVVIRWPVVRDLYRAFVSWWMGAHRGHHSQSPSWISLPWFNRAGVHTGVPVLRCLSTHSRPNRLPATQHPSGMTLLFLVQDFYTLSCINVYIIYIYIWWSWVVCVACFLFLVFLYV